jgi:hypothetical protein
MNRCIIWIPAAVLLASATILLADAPATQPAADPVHTYRAFLLDIQQGNPVDLGRICSAKQGDARQLQADFQSLAIAMGELHMAAAQKWGADAADSVMPALPSLTDLDDVAEKIVGDHAEVGGGSVWLVHLVQINGKWVLDLDWLAHSDDMPGNPRWFAGMAKAVIRTSDDISSGRLTTVGAVTEAIQAREQAIPDTTQPDRSQSDTTEPTTKP